MKDIREENIEQLKQAIKDAKRLQSELSRNVEDMDRILKEIHTRRPKKPKAK